MSYVSDVIDVGQHTEFYVEENKAVRVFLYNGLHCEKVIDQMSFSKLFCRVSVYCKFSGKLNNWHVVKKQYNPLSALYFYLSQPHFHSCK